MSDEDPSPNRRRGSCGVRKPGRWGAVARTQRRSTGARRIGLTEARRSAQHRRRGFNAAVPPRSHERGAADAEAEAERWVQRNARMLMIRSCVIRLAVGNAHDGLETPGKAAVRQGADANGSRTRARPGARRKERSPGGVVERELRRWPPGGAATAAIETYRCDGIGNPSPASSGEASHIRIVRSVAGPVKRSRLAHLLRASCGDEGPIAFPEQSHRRCRDGPGAVSGKGRSIAGNPREGPRPSGYYLEETNNRGDRKQWRAAHRTGCSGRCTGCSISGRSGRCPTAQLLDRFVSRRDEAAEAAFEELVIRHGPMVLRVCRSVLHDAHDAEDAFQAVFLVLASRAGSIRRGGSVASWLFGVARRVAACRGRAHARRRTLDRRVAERTPESYLPADDDPDWEILHEEIDGLPERLRAPDRALLSARVDLCRGGASARALGGRPSGAGWPGPRAAAPPADPARRDGPGRPPRRRCGRHRPRRPSPWR